jgi:hypothetical protein
MPKAVPNTSISNPVNRCFELLATKPAYRSEDDQLLCLISLSYTNKIRQEKQRVKKFTHYALLKVVKVRDRN